VSNDQGFAKNFKNPRFFLDPLRLYAKIVRVTIDSTWPGGGGTMGESWNQKIQISAFCFPNFCFPLFHLIPLNSTWFHLVPLPAPPRGGMNPTSFLVKITKPAIRNSIARRPHESAGLARRQAQISTAY
jgi:hypothetical protein